MAKGSGRKKNRLKQAKSEPPKRLRAILSTIGKALVGIFLGMFVGPYFLPLLPGPEITATLSGGRREGSPCIYYSLSIMTEEPIEYIYLKYQFPDAVNNFKGGIEDKTFSPTKQPSMRVFIQGVDAKGECVVQGVVPIHTGADIQVSTGRNTVALHTSKLPGNTAIVGMIATTASKPEPSPPLPIFHTEGAYEYRRLGQTIRKPLYVSYTGIMDETEKKPTGLEQETP